MIDKITSYYIGSYGELRVEFEPTASRDGKKYIEALFHSPGDTRTIYYRLNAEQLLEVLVQGIAEARNAQKNKD